MTFDTVNWSISQMVEGNTNRRNKSNQYPVNRSPFKKIKKNSDNSNQNHGKYTTQNSEKNNHYGFINL